MMADLTPDERAALSAAQWDMMFALHPVHPKQAIAIWRAARAFQAEQDAQLLPTLYDEAELQSQSQSSHYKCGYADALNDGLHAIRERAKGLT